MRKPAVVALLLTLVLIPLLTPAAAPVRTLEGQTSLKKGQLMSIAVTSPAGGENWSQDGTCLIKWTYKGNPGAAVNIYLMQGTDRVKALAMNVPLSNGQFLWRVDKDIKLGDNYSIAVESAEHTNAVGKSQTFRIAQLGNSPSPATGPRTPSPQITVTKPEPGSKWRAGYIGRVDWHYTGNPPGQAKVLLMLSGEVIKTIRAGESWGEGGGDYIDYPMPSDVPPASSYKIKVVSTTDDKCYGTSGNFVITPWTSLKITYPGLANPVPNWLVGSVHTITWTYTDNCGAYVKIELRGGPNDGNKIYTLKENWPIGTNGTGSFQWTVPPPGTNGINWIPGNLYQLELTGLNPLCWSWSGKFTVSLYFP
jgi:hypothetical protein